MIQLKHPKIDGVTKVVRGEVVESWLKQGWKRDGAGDAASEQAPAETKKSAAKKRTQPKKG